MSSPTTSENARWSVRVGNAIRGMFSHWSVLGFSISCFIVVSIFLVTMTVIVLLTSKPAEKPIRPLSGSIYPRQEPRGYRAAAAASCLGRCGDVLDTGYSCQCNSQCSTFGDCCGDYDSYCVTGTCHSRCGDRDGRYPCHCDDQCVVAGDCCTDFVAQCKPLDSCAGKCSANYDATLPCQCNTLCAKYGNCCNDYASLCTGNPVMTTAAAPLPVPADISALASSMWALDTSRADVGSDVILDYGGFIANSYAESDLSPNRLFTSVRTAVLERPTIKAMIKLMDNYVTSQGSQETTTATERAEEDDFMTALFNTDVMLLTHQFLTAKGYYTGSLTAYKDFVRGLLFDHYSRKASGDSSGFEHVFAGEWSDSASVSGFHNWVQMYLLEKSGLANYHGYLAVKQPSVVKFQFTWSGRLKPVTSSMIGASPEFEVGLFAVCFLTSPNDTCKVTLDGHNIDVRTYDYKGADVLGSAYFIG